MKTLLLIVILVISKVLLKAIAPYTNKAVDDKIKELFKPIMEYIDCLLYTSPSPRDMRRSRMPSSA